MSDKQLSPHNELMPVSITEKVEMAKYLAQSDLMPGGLSSPAKVFVALQMGHELGLSPMIAINNIAVIKGRPSLSAGIMDAIVRNHPDFAGISISYGKDPISCTVVIKRRMGADIESIEGYFDMNDAKTAGLIKADSGWEKYPRRMVKARALSFAARDAFPDALAGMVTQEEAEHLPLEPRDVTPKGAPKEVKKDGNDTEIPIEDLTGTMTEEETEQIDAKMEKVVTYITENAKYITKSAVKFTTDKAREHCIRHFYRTGKEPTKYLDELHDKLREQVKTAKAAEKDTEAKKKAEAKASNTEEEVPRGNEGKLMDDIRAKAVSNKEAEKVEEAEFELIPGDDFDAGEGEEATAQNMGASELDIF